MLDKEFKYFLDNQDELVKKYNGKFIVIRDKEVIGAYDTFVDAYFITQERGTKLGTFLIQQCLPGEKCYTTYVRDNIIEMCKPTDGELTATILTKK